jgi:hypothetical protein
MIVTDKKAIFIHINRCAGNSVEALLRQFVLDKKYGITHDRYSPKHLNAREHMEFLGRDVYESFFSFTIVRNPWDKMVSYWKLQKQHKDKSKSYVRGMTFPDWMKSDFMLRVNRQDQYTLRKYSNQYDWLVDEKGNICVDFVAKFENLRNDWRVIAKQLYVTPALPHLNRTEHRHYSHYYDEECIEIVARLFAKDIAYFGYHFEAKYKTSCPALKKKVLYMDPRLLEKLRGPRNPLCIKKDLLKQCHSENLEQKYLSLPLEEDSEGVHLLLEETSENTGDSGEDMKNEVQTQLSDGRWVPAQPMPYYRDTRSFFRRFWHVIRFFYIPFIKDREKRIAAEDRADRIMEKWMVPVEPYTDKNGNWHRM